MSLNAASTTAKRYFLYKQRIGYGLGDFACNLIWQVISLYLLYFYTDVMQLNPWSISIMFLVCRFIDGGTDLLVGYLIDHTHSRWGKNRPWFLFGAIPFAFAAFLAFSVPSISPSGKLVYAYITYLFLSFMYTVVNIPMASILPTMTSDHNERTVLATYRKLFAFVGAGIVSASALTLVNMVGQGNEALGFRMVMGIFGIIGCVCFFLTFALVKETNQRISNQNVTLKEAIHSLRNNKPWKVFALNILFMWGGYFLQSSALIYYYSYYVGEKEMATWIASIMSMLPILANFIVPYIAKRIGKRNLYSISAGVQLIGIVLIMMAQTNHTIIVVGACISALGYGAKESIYFSMQADPVDYGEWKSQIQIVGTLSSVNGFLGKVAQALAGGISGIFLALGSYSTGSANQSSEAILAIKAMYLYIPIVLLIASIITMHFYTLDKDLPKIQEDLMKRRQHPGT